MDRFDADVLIVGAGPAGSAAATHLARAGRSVIVFDKSDFPRDKPCGEGIMPHGVRMLDELGILERIPQDQRNWFEGITYAVGAQRATGAFPTLEGGYGRGLGVRRTVLDVAAQSAAEAAGATFLRKTSVTGLEREGDAMVVQTRKGTYRGRFLIGADGNRSQTRRRLGLDVKPSKRRRYGVRAHFRFEDPAQIGKTVEVYVTPRGEAYTTPVGPRELLVALLVEQHEMDRFAGNLEAAYEAFIHEDPTLNARFAGRERISKVMACGPLASQSSRPIADHAALVGDAAGFIDPITGEGISIALASARLAGEVISAALEAGDTRVERLVAYEVGRRKEMWNFVLLTSGLLWLSRYPRLAEWAVGRIARHPKIFQKLLGINCGHYTFRDVGLRDVGQLLLLPGA